MGPTLAILGALGGVAAFTAGVWAMLRGAFRMANATDANTRATRELTQRLERLTSQVDGHGERLARLEGRGRGQPHKPPRGNS
jgi:hypothetical protein